MKRPEGFDRGARDQPPPAKVTPIATVKAARAAARAKPAAAAPAEEKVPTPRASRVSPAREGRALIRRASRERKAFERGEVKRFTRRARTRRRIIIGALVTVVALVGGMLVAVFSPLLSLDTIEITGTSRIDAAEVHDALDDQLGTPLALIDFGRITDELAEFPLVRSYTAESVPPHTLVISIEERQPIGIVSDGSSFAVVDPAGIVVESVAARPAGLPVIDAGEASIGNPGFLAAVEVLLALPPELLARVDTITASTKDDVGFSLTGGAQSVTWGSADRSATKARVLATLIATQGESAALLYDVSAPDAAVVRSL